MKLTRQQDGLSFLLTTKNQTVGINTEKGDLQLFLSEQQADSDGLFHWPGEYERNGVSFFITPPFGEASLGKVFVEGVRFVFFTDNGLRELSDELLKSFGNTDVLIIEKTEDGLSKGDMKKLIEKVDPRILIACEGYTANLLKEYSFPFTPSQGLSVSKSSLPNDISEYIIL